MHVKGLGSGIHTYGLLSAISILIPKYSISTRMSKLRFTFPKVNRMLLTLPNLNSFSSFLDDKVRNGSSELPLEFSSLQQGVILRNTPLFCALNMTHLRCCWDVFLISMSSVNKYLCGAKACIHMLLNML